MKDLEQAMASLRDLASRGWRFKIFFDGDRVEDLWAWAGDCNCPHPKEYDPADGHGWSQWNAEDDDVWDDWLKVVGEDGASFPDAIAFAAERIGRIVPGQKK